jgi:hypothetical protein
MENTNQQEQNTETKPTDFSRRFNLKFGYQDKQDKDVIHKEVVISRRPTGADFLKAADEGRGSKTQINLSVIASTISVFGSLPAMPAPLTVLMSLCSIDREQLSREYNLYAITTQPEQEIKSLATNRLQLAFGIERDGVKYHIVEFGNLLDGYEESEAEEEAQNDTHLKALKIAREIVKLSTLDGSQSISGSLTLSEIESMDGNDFLALWEAESQWLDSFRD